MAFGLEQVASEKIMPNANTPTIILYPAEAKKRIGKAISTRSIL